MTGGEERDWLEHLEALKRFGGQMPFAETYMPRRCDDKRERKSTEGNLLAESAKWERYIEEARAEIQAQREADARRTEPHSEPEGCERGSGPTGENDPTGDDP